MSAVNLIAKTLLYLVAFCNAQTCYFVCVNCLKDVVLAFVRGNSGSTPPAYFKYMFVVSKHVSEMFPPSSVFLLSLPQSVFPLSGQIQGFSRHFLSQQHVLVVPASNCSLAND